MDASHVGLLPPGKTPTSSGAARQTLISSFVVPSPKEPKDGCDNPRKSTTLQQHSEGISAGKTSPLSSTPIRPSNDLASVGQPVEEATPFHSKDSLQKKPTSCLPERRTSSEKPVCLPPKKSRRRILEETQRKRSVDAAPSPNKVGSFSLSLHIYRLRWLRLRMRNLICVKILTPSG